ncbi:TetR/AcrR family transcriptional regulator [Rhodococcus qingshengii]|uniref:TetR/AcrR family transcriptional regulator n=1 Tax=Rhodococcus qingshengii TaxID=334542 RepID=UPI0010A65E00|nr:TetR/AcrR family transcriptional regulator [Rhodococcus qingshengii]THJ67673.1 TetR/AcrR family transcriptional regulator [Rhodococcus qingshengii]
MRTDSLILQAAEEQFYERSFDGVGVAAIGAGAGVTPSAIYRHFESKDEILAVLFDQAIDALLRHTAEEHSDPREELAYLVAGHLDFALEKERLSAIWVRESRSLVEPYKRRVQRRQRQYIDRWVECLDSCYPGWKRADILAVVRAVHSILTSDTMRPTSSPRSPVLKAVLTSSAMHAVRALER